MSECDILIIGAGPVGTALAVELAIHKVSFRIVDQAPVRSDKSRALVVQSRTLELLNRHGAARELYSRGTEVLGTAICIDRKPTAFINLESAAPAEAEFPLPLMISQAETEKFLDECLAKHGAAVERPVTATSIIQDPTGVTTELEHLPDGRKETVRSRYVVGCDGAHSKVRHSASNLTFEGAAYPQEFALCDARLRDNTNVAQDRISMHFGYGMLAVIPLGDGLLRFIASGTDPAEATGKTDSDGEPTLEYFQRMLETFTPPGGCGTIHDPVWISRFRLHHRGVNRYRDGRLFVCGDAAHIHSPAGGQGMNTGMQDAYNLGWKLAAVLQNKVSNPEALLDSYHAERHPVGQQLLRGTDRLFVFVSSRNWLWVRFRNLVLPWLLPWLWSSLARTQRAYQFISELGINYRGSPIVGGTTASKGGRVAGGDRLPDGEIRRVNLRSTGEAPATRVHHICMGAPHHLILFTGSGGVTEEEEGGMRAAFAEVRDKITALAPKDEVKTHVIGTGASAEKLSAAFEGSSLAESLYLDTDGIVHGRFGFGSDQGPGYALVRPDGYLAHIGWLSGVEELERFLQGYF